MTDGLFDYRAETLPRGENMGAFQPHRRKCNRGWVLKEENPFYETNLQGFGTKLKEK